ncbi:transforming acidic coiled-coil-containing protein 3-like isoform X1 [Sinocyclocheilus rhinocerous]|uniref:transforming acidic coiled-coil-containing protein 3-like isoform X1 n=1 Tax=Sinocyclocheilus rhinocerous TaxID=307959 RepID=UPI0007B7A1DF|nr:PREDICTED: transforming acidic coiled-coil-containing protein 3-like isoform X1 [Sinocyclocheilus rhinocerous]XP_016364190.1 PREDICTED: transforming acidic coiled-coil-containing protein 3-like isoform X1 [Sinocyclocheilus rhinocerous]XP_016364191.1 PREDICTED: transforming acidic coiled-coil-containing protein 3-like isoform X1 [Sinocyclocheilus rhinocerous]XP_016364192.1 PREDICTED: transforming acidic coiled-coil-containing protein 3-like isoform X1 [Sinocyclocheilus rhinocerous]
MSSEALKENQGAVRMNSTSEAACDIFALEQPTGRPSILRQSQADNISRTALRGAKVCFQTPRRDPVTKKIMSPSRASRPSSQEDSSKALETLTASNDQSSLLNNPSTTPTDMQSNSVAYPDDEMLVKSRGAYTLDLDNLDAINPFQGSSTMQNSPPKSSALPESWTSELVESDTTAAPISAPQPEVPEVTDTALDETLPFVPSVENSLAECSANISSAEGTVIIKTDNIENCATDVEESDMTEPALVSQPIPVLEDQPEAKDSARLPVGSFNLDFDNLDSLNPFQTGGSKIPNSPLIGKASVVSDPPLPSQETKREPELSVHTPDVPTSSDASIPPQENSTATEGSSSTVPLKENQMLLEFNFDDGAEVKRKPPPKRLGVKRPAGAKPVTKKPVAPATENKEPEPKQLSPKNPEETEPVDVPPPKGSYTFDFDKFDDPNFNPFGTKATMGNSPPRGVQTSPVLMKAPAPVQEPEAFAQDDQPEAPAQDDQPEHSSPPAVSETYENIAETDLPVTKRPAEDIESFTMSSTNIPQNPALQMPDLMATPESKVDLLNQTCDLGMAAPSEDEFVPGALFMPGGDFDGQIDYLEQFGSSTFKESALRKQSLYLKFDPLLKESPKKTGMDSGNSGFNMPRPSLAIRMMEAAKSEVKQKSHSDSMKLLDDLPPPPVETVVPDPTVLDLLVPTLKQPVKTEDSIIEFLKYSQRDMDAALQKAERQAEERQQELTTQIEKLQLENQHMLFIVSEFEATITQITDEHKQKEDLAKIELERVLLEKDQLSKDLNELERSFSSVVKRLDRCKEVIEGFKKNEETLKQYAQNCMDRLQKEEKRYQALKAHAEEKLDQANKAINEVRTKQGAEVAALQVQLKREQLKVQSLEKDLEQKAKEVKDVTELCDELLLKVQKHGF